MREKNPKIHFVRDEFPLRIAYLSPLPPDKSGIVDYSRELLPHLARYVEITVYSAGPETLHNGWGSYLELRDLRLFMQEVGQYDMTLYQMGNSEFHEPFYPLLLQYPGVVDLHDYFLHHFIAHRTLGKNNFAAYARELGYVFGEKGLELAIDIRSGRKSVPLYEVPLNKRLMDVSLGLIVHSDYVAEKVRQHGFNRPLHVVPQIIEDRQGQSRRQELDLAPEDILFAAFGLITSAKQVDLALRAFQALRQTFSNIHFLLVGEAQSEVNPEVLIQQMGLGDVVHLIGYVPDLTGFVDWIHTADIVINLRYPTAGETSATALRAMAAGQPVIVFDHGWYAEIPDGAAVKVPALDEEALLKAMAQLAESAILRQNIGNAAQRYTAEVCHPSAVAKIYSTALKTNLEFYWQRYG